MSELQKQLEEKKVAHAQAVKDTNKLCDEQSSLMDEITMLEQRIAEAEAKLRHGDYGTWNNNSNNPCVVDLSKTCQKDKGCTHDVHMLWQDGDKRNGWDVNGLDELVKPLGNIFDDIAELAKGPLESFKMNSVDFKRAEGGGIYIEYETHTWHICDIPELINNLRRMQLPQEGKL